MTLPLPSRIGRFQVVGLLGHGAMGIVYRGRDDALERDVALKVMSAAALPDAENRERFLREARASARLQHPNIITIYELGEHEGQPFMALELLEGLDLQHAIEAGMRPDPGVIGSVVLQVLAGLGHAHAQGVVHRDVKPSNVFIPPGRPVKIMDFGVARLAAATLTTTGKVLGTPSYMSPEQVRAGEVDGRSDLFSVGLILYEMLTGEKAFRAGSVVAVLYKIVNEPPDLSRLPRGAGWDPLCAVIERALARDPADRHPSAAEMSKELVAALEALGATPEWTLAPDLSRLTLATPRPGRAPADTWRAQPTRTPSDSAAKTELVTLRDPLAPAQRPPAAAPPAELPVGPAQAAQPLAAERPAAQPAAFIARSAAAATSTPPPARTLVESDGAATRAAAARGSRGARAALASAVAAALIVALGVMLRQRGSALAPPTPQASLGATAAPAVAPAAVPSTVPAAAPAPPADTPRVDAPAPPLPAAPHAATAEARAERPALPGSAAPHSAATTGPPSARAPAPAVAAAPGEPAPDASGPSGPRVDGNPPGPVPSAAAGATEARGPTPDEQATRAERLLEQRRYASALAEAKAVLERDPGHAVAREIAQDAEAMLLVESILVQAREAWKNGDRETTLAELRKGLAVRPNDARLLALWREVTR